MAPLVRGAGAKRLRGSPSAATFFFLSLRHLLVPRKCHLPPQREAFGASRYIGALQRPPLLRPKSRPAGGWPLYAACGRCDEGAVGAADWGRDKRHPQIRFAPSIMSVGRGLAPAAHQTEAQRSGFGLERKKEEAKCSFRGSYANRGNGMQRLSSDDAKRVRFGEEEGRSEMPRLSSDGIISRHRSSRRCESSP